MLELITNTMPPYHDLTDQIAICEVCGLKGPCDTGYKEPYYSWGGKLYHQYPEKYRGGFGGHFEKRVHFRRTNGFETIGLPLCSSCHSLVAHDYAKESIATTKEEFHRKLQKMFLFRAWARAPSKTDTEPSGFMLYSHNHYPFVPGLVLAVPGSDDPTTKDDIWKPSKFRFVIVTKVYPTDKVPEWAMRDTEYQKSIPNDSSPLSCKTFICKTATNGREFNVYVEVIPYEETEEKKAAARTILEWMSRILGR